MQIVSIVYEWDMQLAAWDVQEATEDNRKNNEIIYWLFRTVRWFVLWNLPVNNHTICYEETNVQEGLLDVC